jgi:hypothetical protein
VPDEATAQNPPAVKKPGMWDRPLEQVNATIWKAEKGDKVALGEVRRWLANPGIADILSGNPAREALRVLIEQYTSSPVIREAVTRKLDEMRAELSGPSPTPLESLLVERVVATWLYLHRVEVAFGSASDYTLRQGEYHQKVITAAQKRHLAAIKGLSEVRRLALPALQVNIAKKQVNVAGTVTTATPATDHPRASGVID